MFTLCNDGRQRWTLRRALSGEGKLEGFRARKTIGQDVIDSRVLQSPKSCRALKICNGKSNVLNTRSKNQFEIIQHVSTSHDSLNLSESALCKPTVPDKDLSRQTLHNVHF